MNKREFVRYNSPHLVYYSLFNQAMTNCGEGVGKTINISEGGVLLELSTPPLGEFTTVVLELALRDSLVKFQGRVVYANQLDGDKMEVGIQFVAMTDEQKNSLLDFLKRFASVRGHDVNLIREKVSTIDNVVLTLSKEHRIIKDYVIGCRNILEGKAQGSKARDLEILFYFMEKDMLRHFRFEEEILFVAAVAGEQNENMTRLVRLLKSEHGVMKDQIRDVRNRLGHPQAQDNPVDDETLKMINGLMDTFKNHAREEIIHLFPAIDTDKEKIRVVNRLLTGRH